ncbi:MAG: hypothetical protein Q7S75_03475 [bacterium]|nr:hypothetical protein [bacterium]
MVFIAAPNIQIAFAGGISSTDAILSELKHASLFLYAIDEKCYLCIQIANRCERIARVSPEQIFSLIMLPDETLVTIKLDGVRESNSDPDNGYYLLTVTIPKIGSFGVLIAS